MLVGPGSENEIEEIAKMDIERTGQRALGLASLGPRSRRMVPLVPEAWMEAQPASELHFGFCGACIGEVTVRKLLSAGMLPPFRGNCGSCSGFAARPSFLPAVGVGP